MVFHILHNTSFQTYLVSLFKENDHSTFMSNPWYICNLFDLSQTFLPRCFLFFGFFLSIFKWFCFFFSSSFFPNWNKANARIQMVHFTLSADVIMLLWPCVCRLKWFVILPLYKTDRNANRKACISSYVSHQHFRRQVTFFAACSSSTPSPITTYTTFLPNLCIIRSKQLSFPGR